jgi:hypothetical protein
VTYLPLLFAITMFVVYWGGMAAIIWMDEQRARERARASGLVDFRDRRVLPYMLLGVLCGPLPLVVYFGATRRSVGGWLLGLVIGVGWSLLVSGVFSVGLVIVDHAVHG